MDAAAASLASALAGAAAIPFTQRQQVLGSGVADGGEAFHAGVALLERHFDPAAPLEPPLVVALVDHRLVAAVGMLLRLDQQVEAPPGRAVGDVLVAVAVAAAAEPGVARRFGRQAGIDPRDLADVVEDDVIRAVLPDDAARLEHAAAPGRRDQIGEPALFHETHLRLRHESFPRVWPIGRRASDKIKNANSV